MRLKIAFSDYKRLQAAVNAEPVQIYARSRLEYYQKLHNSPGNPIYQRDYIERYRWDVFAKADAYDDGLVQQLYTYLNDDNIAAALKKLIKG